MGINVLVEKKDVDNPEDYKRKENQIIDQTPKYNKDEELKLEKGDTMTLYIPNIVDVYPDMVAEKWTLEDAQAFADEYGLTLDITEEESEEEPGTIISQGRPAGDTIIKGITLKVTVAKEKSKEDPIDDLVPGNDKDEDNNKKD